MFINVIKSYRNVVAICDKELLGKVFEEGNFQLDVKENFFKGEEEASEEKAIQRIRQMSLEDSTFNIVGEESVNAAIKAGILSNEEVGRIKDIPFALVLV
jgi:hypothetical protein|tara:strand:- start:321 stop:620 length:300 start_codon:yes stop_codon:yes gene_type:complete